MNKNERYISNILSGEVYHGKWIKLLVDQLESDKVNSHKWVFRQDIADKYIRFIELLVFTEGEKEGQRISLEDWQAFVVSNIFGWVSKEDSSKRRFVEMTLCVPRKNGKSTLSGILALAAGVIDDEQRGQIYMGATAQKQARLCFDSAWYAVKATPNLSSLIGVGAHHLMVKKNNTYIRYISSEAGAIEGTNPSVAIIDEEHLMPDNELREALRLGMGSRKNPLFISISTAGSDKSKPYFQHINNSKNILNGHSFNDRHLTIIYEPDEDMDWEDERTWVVANPNWGVSIDPDLFRQDYIEAKNQPSKQPMFSTKRLNIWSDSEKTWIDSKVWAARSTDKTLEDFEGEECYLGLDLGVTGDFSAMAILIPQYENIYLFMKFWIPEEMAKTRTKADGLKFMQWAREKKITLTEGNATDFNKIKSDIVNLNKTHIVKMLSFDRAYASMLSTQLFNDEGIEAYEFSQSISSVTGPTKQFAEYVLNETLLHDGNPVMSWMMANVLVYIDDANGNLKIHKGKSKNKVDGPTAVVNAIGAYLKDYDNNYSNQNIIIC